MTTTTTAAAPPGGSEATDADVNVVDDSDAGISGQVCGVTSVGGNEGAFDYALLTIDHRIKIYKF